MPTISRVRIVNFRYNDGGRIIPDIVLNFHNSDWNTVDTLLDLENGGGKTVLVQILLQPVIPNAKVQDRRISDHFKKSSDHAFILTEWKLDRSSDRLLTGIAISAAANTDEENDNRTVKYYTFISHSAALSGKDLLNLFPLTEIKNGKLSVSSFEEVRQCIKNSRFAEYYHQDSVKKYQAKLEEYGIMHSEWENILVKVNEREGGIEKFIEAYDTTDKLLDSFIIPSIIGAESRTKDRDADIVNGFLNYAKSYSEKSQKLTFRKELSEFKDKLKEFQPTIKHLWETDDKRIHAIRELFDYIFSLNREIKRLEKEKSEIEAQLPEQQKKLDHVKAEKLSFALYKIYDELDKQKEAKNAAEKAKSETDDRKAYYTHLVQVLYAAEKFAELTAQKHESESIIECIKHLEADNMNGYAASLKYSLFLAAQKELESASIELECIITELGNCVIEKESAVNEYKRLVESIKVKRSETDELVGRCKLLGEQAEAVITETGFDIARMLDGSYNNFDITRVQADLDKQTDEYSEKSVALERESESCEESIEQINIELQAEKVAINDNVTETEKANAEIDEYYKEYEKVKSIVIGISLTEKQIFTEEPKRYLTLKIAETEDLLSNGKRKSEQLTEQLENTLKGTLHLPKSASDILSQIGIDYETGTSYLLDHEKIMTTLLNNEPLLAFSVIVENDKERNKLLSAIDDESWISAAIPVFTYAEIDELIQNASERNSEFITAYSRGYFKDKASYADKIRELIINTENDNKLLSDRLAELKQKLFCIESFIYPPDYEKTKLSEITILNEKVKAIQKNINNHEQRIIALKKRQSEIKEEHKRLSDTAKELQSRKYMFSNLIEKIKNINDLTEMIEVNKNNLSELEARSSELDVRIEGLKSKAAEFNERQKLLNESKIEYDSVISETRNTDKADIIGKEYEQLKMEYDSIKQTYSSDLQALQARLDNCRRLINKLNTDLYDTGVDESEYRSVEFSSTKLKKANNYVQQLEKELNDLNVKCSDLSVECGILSERSDKVISELEKLGMQVLPKSDVGSDFERRIKECNTIISDLTSKLNDAILNIRNRKSDLVNAVKYGQKYQDPSPEREHTPIDIINKSIDDIKDSVRESENALTKAEQEALRKLDEDLFVFRDLNHTFKGVINLIRRFIASTNEGDRYFSLNEKIEKDILSLGNRIEELDIVLKDVENSHYQLVQNCLQRSRRLYDDLNTLSGKSTVNIMGKSKQMIKIDLPEISDNGHSSEIGMSHYIDDCISEFLSSPLYADFKKREAMAYKYMSPRRLLNCYIGKEEILIKVYKIDRTPQSCTYRLWETALKANSGGEKFVVFFALILSMMNFSRGISESLKHTTGVLILDNPFGSISSQHLLEPMFEIARKFHIQLICLTHLGTQAIVRCFTNVYGMKLKRLPLSGAEVLEAEPKQQLEQANYQVEQLSLL